MNHDQYSHRRTLSEEDKPLLLLGMIGIMEQASMRIVESGLGFFKPDAMLGPIALFFRSSQSNRSMSR